MPENRITRKPNLLLGFPLLTDLKGRVRRRWARRAGPLGIGPGAATSGGHEGCPEGWVKEVQPMIRLVVFLAIGVMGLILVRVRRQRKARTAMPAE